jgi:hypothetical protein
VTAFVLVDLVDRNGCQKLREGAAHALSVADTSHLRLLHGQNRTVLNEDASLTEQGIKNDDVVIAVLRVDGSTEWEPPNVIDPSSTGGGGL